MGGTRLITLRYPDVCAHCGAALPAGGRGWWDVATRRVSCQQCGAWTVDPASGSPGGSAEHEYERRRDAREARIREAHPRIGGLLLALSDEPQSTQAWAQGAEGERAVAHAFAGSEIPTLRLLNDLRVPGTRANIDHVAVTPNEVFVIDAKRYRGDVTVDRGGLFDRRERLLVAGRDRTHLVHGAQKQAGLVTGALQRAGCAHRVTAVLCFVEADWSLFASPLAMEGVTITWPRALVSAVADRSTGNVADTLAAERAIAAVFVPAS